MATISKSFKNWMVEQGYGTFGTDLFINQVSAEAPDKATWLLTAGGNPIRKLSSGEQVRQYFITVYMRNTDPEWVDDTLADLTEKVSNSNCLELEGFEVYETPEVTGFPADQDVDSVDRSVGLLQVNVKTYKKP
jgi:hypothetical protein